MPYDSTATAPADNDEQQDSTMPIILDQPETTFWHIGTGLSPSSGAVQKTVVQSRFKETRPYFNHIWQDREHFQVLENWEGVVKDLGAGAFFADMRLTNSTSNRATDEFEIEMDNVSKDDHELVRVGAVFYLTVGIRRPLGEGPQKTTRIIFRRMPRWSPRSIESANADANKLWEKFRAAQAAQQLMVGSKPEAQQLMMPSEPEAQQLEGRSEAE